MSSPAGKISEYCAPRAASRIAPAVNRSIGTENLAAIAKALPDPVVLIDSSAMVVWANQAAEKLFGMELEEIKGANALDYLHLDDVEFAAVSITSVLTKEVGTPIELRVRTAEGYRLVELVGANKLDDEGVGGLLLTMRDLTQRRRWEVAGNNEGRFRSLVHNAASVIMLIDRDGHIKSVSSAITRILGHDQELLEGRLLSDIVVENDRSEIRSAIDRSIDSPDWNNSPTVVEVDLLPREDKQGGPIPFELSIVNLLNDPTVEGLVVSGHDITQLRATREALEELATHDPLTGLPNRVALHGQLELALSNPKAAVVFLDLDGFKAINDQFGHAAGDEILKIIATRLRSSVRRCDVVARYGGDEFVIIATIAEYKELEILSSRLAGAVEQPIDIMEGTFTLSASVGMAHPRPDDTPTTLLARADTAMYIAKQHGDGPKRLSTLF